MSFSRDDSQERSASQETSSSQQSPPPTLRTTMKAGDTAESHNIQVMVRVRPFNSREISQSAQDAKSRSPQKIKEHSSFSFEDDKPLDSEFPVSIVFMKGDVVTVLDHSNNYTEKEAFNFDHAFWSILPSQNQYSEKEFASQEDVFKQTGKRVVEWGLAGYNCTIMAYGQTGSGKTHSMLGTSEDPGISPRLIQKLFASIREITVHEKGSTFTIELSFLEIYNEKVKDLLAMGVADGKKKKDKDKDWNEDECDLDNATVGSTLRLDKLESTFSKSFSKGSFSKSLRANPNNLASPRSPLKKETDAYSDCKVRFNPEVGTYVEGLRRARVDNEDQCQAMISDGMVHRAVASTQMNSTSSRSHAIFQICIKQKNPAAGTQKVSIINLVDLAGSEKIKLSGATGSTLTEAKNINQSLSTLRRVIDVLIENSHSKKKMIAPFRESILTWVLSDSLGGNSRTMLLSTISPYHGNADDTINTLRYALKAKAIVCHVHVNEEKTAVVVSALKAEMDQLRAELLKKREGQSAVHEDPEELREFEEELKRREAAYQIAMIEQHAMEAVGKELQAKIVERDAQLTTISADLERRQKTAQETDALSSELTRLQGASKDMQLHVAEQQAENKLKSDEIAREIQQREDFDKKSKVQAYELQRLEREAVETRKKRFAMVFRKVGMASELAKRNADVTKDVIKMRERSQRMEPNLKHRRRSIERITLEISGLRHITEVREHSTDVLAKDMSMANESKLTEMKRLIQATKDGKDERKRVLDSIQKTILAVERLKQQSEAMSLAFRLQLSDCIRDSSDAEKMSRDFDLEVQPMARKVNAMHVKIADVRSTASKQAIEHEELELTKEQLDFEIAHKESCIAECERKLTETSRAYKVRDIDIQECKKGMRVMEAQRVELVQNSAAARQFVQRQFNPQPRPRSKTPTRR